MSFVTTNYGTWEMTNIYIDFSILNALSNLFV